MMPRGETHPANLLLQSLSEDDLTSLQPDLELVPLTLDAVLFPDGAPMTHAYFPISGMISLVTTIDGVGVESATVGAEGVLGLSLFLNAGRASNDCIVQIQGEAWRLPAAAFLGLLARSPHFSQSVNRYIAARLWVSYRSAACNLMHSLPRRTARWLLVVHDHVTGDQFNLTHRYLAQMLGVRRASVTTALGVLQDAGILTSRRGKVTVLDRQRLEAEACECDGIIRTRYALVS